MTDLRESIKAVLTNASEPLSAGEIRERLGYDKVFPTHGVVRTQTIGNALGSMHRRGKVIKTMRKSKTVWEWKEGALS